MICGHTKYEGKPPCNCNPELNDTIAELSQALDAIEKVLEIHHKSRLQERNYGADPYPICAGCGRLYPCPTIKAILGR